MPRVPYSFLRGLELSGRHPRDDGEWVLTAYRMRHGEGEPSFDDPCYEVEFPDGAEYPPAPGIPPHRLRPRRSALYRRIRSSEDAARFIQKNGLGLQASLHIFPSWWSPIDGYIPLPPADAAPLPDTHCVPLVRVHNDVRRFEFQNSWGPWGLNRSGIGFIDFEYLDRYGFESWAAYYGAPTEWSRSERRRLCQVRRWITRDEWGNRVYGFQILHPRDDERWAWAFVLERDGGLEVEELYVMPACRGRGHGSLLAEMVGRLVREKRLPLRVWVPFSDTRSESPGTFGAMLKTASKLGVKFADCPVKWAAYFAASDINGEPSPPEPALIPSRPKAILEAVIVAALSLLPTPSELVENPAIVESVATPEVGDSAWDTMNAMRGRLIRKKNRELLSTPEAEQLEKLQYLTKRALQRRFPGGGVHEGKYRDIVARLGEDA